MKRTVLKDDLPYLAVHALENLGSLITTARRQRLWTQADLAAKADMSLSTIAQIEKGLPTVAIGHWVKALWAVDQLDRLIELTAPQNDISGVNMMVQQLPRRVRISARKLT